jgi:hypothetical protein
MHCEPEPAEDGQDEQQGDERYHECPPFEMNLQGRCTRPAPA